MEELSKKLRAEIAAYNERCKEISLANKDLDTILKLCRAEFEKLSPEGKKAARRLAEHLGQKVYSQLMGTDYNKQEE